MSTKQSSGLIGRLIRRSLLLIVTLALMAVTAAGLMINGILNGPSPIARNQLVLKLVQDTSTDWIPEMFLEADVIDQILSDTDENLSGNVQKEG